MKPILPILVLIALFLPALPPAHAALIYLDIPAITGINPVPGYPAAMEAQSLGITPDSLTITKTVDAATPLLSQALADGTTLHHMQVLLYNPPATGLPNESLAFSLGLVSSVNILTTSLEQDTFNTTTPASIFLSLPGITGLQSTPGHPGVLQIQSFTLDSTGFTIVRNVDAASPSIASAVTLGTHFPTASLLFYDTTVPTGPPDGVLLFDQVLASSHQTFAGGDVTPTEQDTFAFAGLPQPMPEPSAAITLLAGAVVIGAARRRRRRTAIPQPA